MAVYAVSDLHLSFGVDKPMDIFGNIWKDYEKKLEKNWNNTVNEDDTVLICGDISWATYLPESVKDFEYINKLKGNKIILRGNHDYYFQTRTKQELFFKDNEFNTLSVLHNNCFEVENYIVCGTRGWQRENKEDERIFKRELGRFRISLEKGKKLQEKYLEKGVKKNIIVATHFPPFFEEIYEIFKEYNVKKCVYGHLHGYGHSKIQEGIIEGVEYNMVSIDYTKLNVIKL